MQILKRKPKFDSSDILPLFALGTLGLQVLLLLISFGSIISLWAMAHKPVPSMVQLLDGHSIAMEPVDNTQRTPNVVQQYVKNSLSLMFTWNGKIPAAHEAQTPSAATVNDPGVSVSGSGRITTSSWQASFALAEDFRTPFLEQIASLTPPEVFSGNAESVLSFEFVSDPKPIGEGEWQVDVVANLLIFDSAHPQGLAVPFNKSIFVRAIAPTPDPLPEDSSPIQQAVYRIQSSGLQIREIHDLDIQQLNH